MHNKNDNNLTMEVSTKVLEDRIYRILGMINQTRGLKSELEQDLQKCQTQMNTIQETKLQEFIMYLVMIEQFLSTIYNAMRNKNNNM